MAGRQFDIVLYGATGFVGSRAAEYLAASADMQRLRWAIAGRDRAKLHSVKSRLGESGAKVGVLVADSRDLPALDALASAARIVLNMAGPFALYGDGVVDTCVRHRTHYVDITGETAWVRGLIDRHHERAARDGTRIIPFCGFDSVPSDLGSFALVRDMQRVLGTPCTQVIAYFQMSGGFNGGTLASNAHRYESGQVEPGRDPFLLNPAGSRSQPGHLQPQIECDRDPDGVRFDATIGAWTGPFIMGPVNTRVVRRSAALFESWNEPYGPAFEYQEYTKYDPPFGHAKAALVTGAASLFGRAMAHATSRRLLKRVLPEPGQGPSERSMNQGWFSTDLIGFAPGGRTARARIHHRGDPGNRATVRFACESALALALQADVLPGGPERGGLLTPATGLGHVLVGRIRKAGVTLDISVPRPARSAA